MRILTKLEQKEFDKTYDFLNHWVGSMLTQADKIDELRFDGMMPNSELIKFARKINNTSNFDELNLFFTNQSELYKINRLFNDKTNHHKNLVMKRLINYCFANKVQPHRLRMNFKEFSVVRNETPIVYEYGRVA